MYAILFWVLDEYVTFLHNEDGSVKLFDIHEADEYANKYDPNGEVMRVISIEAVKT